MDEKKLTYTHKRLFEDVYKDYYLLIQKYIYKRISDYNVSEDLAGNVFFRAFKNYDSYNPLRASEKTWLFCITNNILKNYYRDKKVHIPIDDCENTIQSFGEEDLTDAVYMQDCINALYDAIEKLSECDRKIIVMTYFHGKSVEEIAETLNMTKGNVRVRFMRSKKKLAAILTKNGFIWEG